MNRNRKQMKPEATRLTEAQRCEIIAKLSKPNAPSKRALGPKYEVSEGAIRKVRDNRENILQRIIFYESLSRHLLNLKVLLTSKALKLYTPLSNNHDQLLCSDVQTEVIKHMMNFNDRFRRFNKTLAN